MFKFLTTQQKFIGIQEIFIEKEKEKDNYDHWSRAMGKIIKKMKIKKHKKKDTKKNTRKKKTKNTKKEKAKKKKSCYIT